MITLRETDRVEVLQLQVALERERATRVQAEARVQALEECLAEMEKQLGVAEWLVRALRGELTGDAPPLEERTPRRWWLPWRQ